MANFTKVAPYVIFVFAFLLIGYAKANTTWEAQIIISHNGEIQQHWLHDLPNKAACEEAAEFYLFGLQADNDDLMDYICHPINKVTPKNNGVVI